MTFGNLPNKRYVPWLFKKTRFSDLFFPYLFTLYKTCGKIYNLSKLYIQIKLNFFIHRPENSHFYHGCLYCNIHFKLIFAPKIIYEEEHAPRKPELIIRENEPKELPSEVARGNS